MSAKKEVMRYAESPFRDDLVVPKRDKQIRLSRLGRDDNVLVNHATGEMQGTHVTTFKKVDSEKFVKLFTQNIGLTFDLKPAGIKAFSVLMHTMQEKSLEKDLVPLDKFVLEDFVEKTGKKISLPTFWRGLAELEEAKIIAKNIRAGWYFVNPNFVFNGDRIAFTQVIERQRNTRADDKTIDMFEQLELEDSK